MVSVMFCFHSRHDYPLYTRSGGLITDSDVQYPKIHIFYYRLYGMNIDGQWYAFIIRFSFCVSQIENRISTPNSFFRFSFSILKNENGEDDVPFSIFVLHFQNENRRRCSFFRFRLALSKQESKTDVRFFNFRLQS